jgi:methylated-DNA-[protein]-cysteine S-methyltransferase
MITTEMTLFETPVGPVGIAWSRQGIVGVQLPEKSRKATLERLRSRFPQAEETTRTSPEARRAVDGITRLLGGNKVDLTAVQLDLDGVPEFYRKVYAAARRIRPGETRSYGEVATKLGKPGAARAVGQALGRNPFAILVPCHRVLGADGGLRGFSANGGVTTKKRLLTIEGGSEGTNGRGKGRRSAR